MRWLCAVLILILIASASAHAQDQDEIYLFSEFWLTDDDPVADFDCDWLDRDILLAIIIELCLDLEVKEQEICEVFPDLWDQDYEIYFLMDEN
jgi:hypothetical protein